MSRKSMVGKKWLIANLAILLTILLLWSGCDTASSMYVTNTAATPLYIEVANADEFPAGGGGGLGDMLKSVYDPDDDGVFVLNVLTGDVIDVSETAWAVSAMGAKANGNPLNHDRYADSEAVSAMGVKADNNPLNHDRYTDAAAKAAGATNKLDDLAAPDNNTDLNATTSAHGLLPLLTGVTTVYLNGNGAWTTPAGGSSFKTKTETRNLTAATGDVAYTGYGFTPVALEIRVTLAGDGATSNGFSDANKNYFCHCSNSSTGFLSSVTFVIRVLVAGATNRQDAIVKSYDADGFTLTWTKTGSPTGTVNIMVTAFKD